MTTSPAFFHAALRPSILQILRSTGYHTTRPAVLDSLTDLTARYLQLLCEGTARHATHNHGDSGDFDLVDVRLALQDAGAMLPERAFTEQAWRGEEDLRGIEDFIAWFAGNRMKELMETGKGDGEVDATDYLNALKKKHNKSGGEDTRYSGTILGNRTDAGDVLVEGGPEATITEWISNRTAVSRPSPLTNGHTHDDVNGEAAEQAARSPSSGLSSVGDRLDVDEDEMDLA